MTGKGTPKPESPPAGVQVGIGRALWLVPEEPMFGLLVGRISQLSRQYSTPCFDPHVTLLSRITGKEKDLLAKAASLAGVLKRMQVELGGVGYLDEYFRCMFIRVAPTPPIVEANRVAREAFQLRDEPDYMPHLSLVYGNLRIEEKKKIAEASTFLSGQIIALHNLCLYSVSGPPHQWKCVEEFRLA